MCLGHCKTIELIKQLGENHDKVVKEWKHALEVLRTDDHEELPRYIPEDTPSTDDESYSTESDTDCNMCDDTLLAPSTTGLQLHAYMLLVN